jgi:hypothetical protein
MSDPGHVVVLGAGFSYAVSDAMPLANKLGDLAYGRLASVEPQAAVRFSELYSFEARMSLLAEDRPYLSEVENRQNEAEFAKLLQALVITLDEAQAQALSQSAPRWFIELLTVLHYRQSTVITLNYDSLIDAGVASHGLDPNGAGLQSKSPYSPLAQVWAEVPPMAAAPQTPTVTPTDLVSGRPRDLPSVPWPQAAGAVTLRLLKLHGSLDWWWVPRDQSGATLVRRDTGSRFGAPQSLTDEERSVQLPGLERFIVPPLATKSAYYHTPLTRQLWQDAFTALRAAKRISLVGYSLPVTDVVMSGMLEEAIRGRPVTVEIVNPYPESIMARMEALGGPEQPTGWLSAVEGETCVQDFASSLRDEASATVAGDIGALDFMEGRDSPAWVAWSSASRRIVETTLTSDGCLVVRTDDVPLARSDVRPGQPSSRDVAKAARAARSIVARSSDGVEATIVGWAAADLTDRNAVHWLQLVPAS